MLLLDSRVLSTTYPPNWNMMRQALTLLRQTIDGTQGGETLRVS